VFVVIVANVYYVLLLLFDVFCRNYWTGRYCGGT